MNIKKTNLYKIPRKNGQLEIMEEDEFVRWMCLIEGIIYINRYSDDIELNSTDDEALLMKPIAIQAYLDERFLSMQHDVRVEKSMGHL